MYRFSTWRLAVRGISGKKPTIPTTTRTLSSSSLSPPHHGGVAASHSLPNLNPTSAGSVRSIFSSLQSEEYKSLEYPNAKEPPTITKTVASQVRGQAPRTKDVQPQSPPLDLPVVSAEMVESLRSRPLSPGVSAITTDIPETVPPNVPADQLETPETIITQLDNGVRVVSMETYGQVSVVGSVSALGSQWENPQSQAHVSQVLEALAFGTTRRRDGLAVAHALQDWGGTRFANTGREQSLHCIDVLRPNVGNAMGLLAECLLEPVFDPHEVEEAKMMIQHQATELPPELWLGEALQQAAYGPEQPLGQAHFCPPQTTLDHLNVDTVEQYWKQHYLDNPREIVIAGAGVRHDTLVDMTQQHFGQLQQVDHPERQIKPSVYQGGQCSIKQPTPDEFVRIGLVWPACGWHDDDLVASCVLQTLLGGGNSFSAGGPGKGMYSRLYRQVLNRFSWAESAEATTAFYNDTGLWGLTGSCIPKRAADMVKVLAEHSVRLAVQPVTDEELDRARNMLKNSVLTQLESRLVLFEDLGRQTLTYGKREDMHTTCERIESITQEDLMRVAKMSLQYPPSIAAVGDNLDSVPRHDEVARWFG